MAEISPIQRKKLTNQSITAFTKKNSEQKGACACATAHTIEFQFQQRKEYSI